jgi:hypothetical protein
LPTDGDDVIFGDLGNDWLVGGTGRDHLYGGYGADLLNVDDNHETNSGTNTAPDEHPSYEDLAFGGAGQDCLIANTYRDRLIDWIHNDRLIEWGRTSFKDWTGDFYAIEPFVEYGILRPRLMEFLYDLSANDGADPTRAADTGADPRCNGEPYGELGLVPVKGGKEFVEEEEAVEFRGGTRPLFYAYLTVDFLGRITKARLSSTRQILTPLEAQSPDGSHLIQMKKGTKAVDAQGRIVRFIEIIEAETLPELPPNTVVLGKAYEFRPSGITFNIPFALTLSYDVNELPENVTSVVLAYYTADSGWAGLPALEGVVLAELGKLTAVVDHFTVFAILATDVPFPGPPFYVPIYVPTSPHLAPPPPSLTPTRPPVSPSLAAFETRNLTIIPSVDKILDTFTFVTKVGETCTIAIDIVNYGGQTGQYDATLMVNGIPLEVKQVSIEPGQSKRIEFTIFDNGPGSYVVEVGGQRTEFESYVWINWWLISGLAAVILVIIFMALLGVRRFKIGH